MAYILKVVPFYFIRFIYVVLSINTYQQPQLGETMRTYTIEELFNYDYDVTKFYVLYHGTKGDVNDVIDNPLMKQAANGYGLYLTTMLSVAMLYGNVIAYLVPYDFEVDTIRPMENVKAMEYIINTQHTYVEFIRSMEDAVAV